VLTGVSAIAELQAILNKGDNYHYANTGNTGTNIDPFTRFDAVIDAIFNGKDEEKTEFNNLLTAYKRGLYLQQKQRFSDQTGQGGTSTDTKWNDLFDQDDEISLSKALQTAGKSALLPGTYTDNSNTRMNASQVTTMVATLKASMLNKLNEAMGVTALPDGAAESNEAKNKTAISDLNNDFLTQMGDFAELSAMLYDIKDLSVDLNEQQYWQHLKSNNDDDGPFHLPNFAMAAPQKAPGKGAWHQSNFPGAVSYA
jgi:hypothetical protein